MRAKSIAWATDARQNNRGGSMKRDKPSSAGIARCAKLVMPRGLRREYAAAYLGISPTKFDEWVRRRVMPLPRRLDGIVVWDRYELDDAFERLPNEEAEQDSVWDYVAA